MLVWVTLPVLRGHDQLAPACGWVLYRSSATDGPTCASFIAKPGDELKVEQAVKDFRSLSLPILRSSGAGSTVLFTSVPDQLEQPLFHRESMDILVSVAMVWCGLCSWETSGSH